MVTGNSTHPRPFVEWVRWAGSRVAGLIEDWQQCRHRSARYVSTGEAMAAINRTNQRRHPEAMASKTSPQGSRPRADLQHSQWHDADWDHDDDHDEAAGHHARRLLSSSNSAFHRFVYRLGTLRRWLAGERWLKRLAVVLAAL